MSAIRLVSSVPQGVSIAISGILDEDLDYDELIRLARDHTVLDLDGVTRVTSYGVSRWFSSLAAAPATSLTFIRCHPCMMAQFNIIQRFDCGGTLVSFYLPYLCSTCGAESSVLLDRRVEAVSWHATLPCVVCQGEAEFDDVPEVYFEYLNRAPPVVPNAFVDEVVSSISETNRT